MFLKIILQKGLFRRNSGEFEFSTLSPDSPYLQPVAFNISSILNIYHDDILDNWSKIIFSLPKQCSKRNS